MLDQNISVKVIGSNGQISLGKQFAGQQVLVEQQEVGVWLIRTAKVIPTNELWLHEPNGRKDLEKAIQWAVSHPPKANDPLEVINRLENAKKFRRKSSSARSK